MRADMIQVFKILNGIYSVESDNLFIYIYKCSEYPWELQKLQKNTAD